MDPVILDNFLLSSNNHLPLEILIFGWMALGLTWICCYHTLWTGHVPFSTGNRDSNAFTFMILPLNHDYAQTTTRLDYFLSPVVHTALPTGSLASPFCSFRKSSTHGSLYQIEFTKSICLFLAFQPHNYISLTLMIDLSL
jgi:hypothetical protein